MRFKQKKQMLDAISEYHWNNGELLVFVSNYNFADFMKLFRKNYCLFEDGGMNAYLQDDCVCIPGFDRHLECIGLDMEEIKEIFEEEEL